ncbi:MAG TPA: hypothetical protein VMR23_02220 [Candidatus Limnocylindria bacterium]|nr:hypothetical protein [Candidatus Limnocylindria bacterium]
MTPPSDRIARGAAYALVFLAYLGARAATHAAVEEPLLDFDSGIYFTMAERALTDTRLWADDRPWTLPLVLKLLPADARSITWFQLAASVACWTYLAAQVARTLRAPRLKPVAFAVVLLVGAASPVVVWDAVIMSESLSLSLMALAVAAGLGLAERWRWHGVVLLASVALLWAFARDTNAWVLLAAAALAAVAAALGASPRRLVIVAVLLAACAVASITSANSGRRWMVPFLNVLAERILPSPERTACFAARGMPVTPALLARAGKYAWSDDWAFFEDPALRSFRAWARAHARSTYAIDLAAHPVRTLADPLRELDDLISFDLGQRWRPRGYAPAAGGVPDALYARGATHVWLLLAGMAAAAAVAVALRRRDSRFLVPRIGVQRLLEEEPALQERHRGGRVAAQGGVEQAERLLHARGFRRRDHFELRALHGRARGLQLPRVAGARRGRAGARDSARWRSPTTRTSAGPPWVWRGDDPERHPGPSIGGRERIGQRYSMV